MRMLLLLSLLFAPSIQAQAPAIRTAATIAANALVTIDVAHSIWLQHVDGGYYETNPILGEHPSVLAFGLVWGAVVGVNTFAPKKLRPWINAATIVFEVVAVLHNFHEASAPWCVSRGAQVAC